MNDTQIIYSCLVGGPGIAVAVFIAGPVANTPARCPLHRRKQSMSLMYMVIVGSILNKVAPAPLPFPIYRYVIYLWLDSREWGGRGIRRDMFRNCCICVSPAQYEYNQYIYVEL